MLGLLGLLVGGAGIILGIFSVAFVGMGILCCLVGGFGMGIPLIIIGGLAGLIADAILRRI